MGCAPEMLRNLKLVAHQKMLRNLKLVAYQKNCAILSDCVLKD